MILPGDAYIEVRPYVIQYHNIPGALLNQVEDAKRQFEIAAVALFQRLERALDAQTEDQKRP